MRILRPDLLTGHSEHARWVTLFALSIVLVTLASAVRLPAALLIGPMLAGILIAASGGAVRLPAAVFASAQGLIGFMIGRSIPISVLGDLGRDWPVYILGVLSVIAAASVLGLLLARWRVLPGTTAIWGTSPGASTSMILMSEHYGGDIRLVAVMQYLRVVGVAFVGTVVAKLWFGSAGTSQTAVAWLPSIAWGPLLATVTLASASAFAASALRIPAGAILVPLAISMVLNETKLLVISLPPWLLAASYAIVGWSIGLRFTRPILMQAFWSLPKIIGSILLLMAFCGLVAAGLVAIAGVDPLTAYLATCPGGLDSVAIIAASSPVDQRFVMTMQTLRLLLALLVSPMLARFLAQYQHGR